MQSSHIMVIAIVSIVMLVSFLNTRTRARHGIVRDRRGEQHMIAQNDDTDAMREEIKVLKERIHVLERIATDNNDANDINRQIEALRDK